jgi:hypothetical protein
MPVPSKPVVPIVGLGHPLPPSLQTKNPAAQNAKPWKELNNSLEVAVELMMVCFGFPFISTTPAAL